MQDIKTINYYSSSYDVISENFGYDVFEELTDDEKLFLQCADDYESFSFHVINNELVYVCDSISGDIIGSPVTLEDFKDNLFKYAREEAE